MTRILPMPPRPASGASATARRRPTGARPGTPEEGGDPAVGVDGRRLRWLGHREQRRGRFVAEAMAVIGRDGPDVSMEGIAVAAGVSKAILYRHFRDRSDLHRAVGEALAQRVRLTVAAALDPALPLERQVAAAVDAYLALIEAQPNLYRFVHRPAGDGPNPPRDPVADHTELVGDLVGDILRTRLRPPVLDAATAALWGHAIAGMVHRSGDRWLEQGGGDRAALTAALTSLIWGGLGGAVGVVSSPPPAPGRRSRR